LSDVYTEDTFIEFLHDGGIREVSLHSDSSELVVDFTEFYAEHPDDAIHLLENAEQMLQIYSDAVGKTVRVRNLVETTNIRGVDSTLYGKLIQLEAMVVSTAIPESALIEGEWICGVCGASERVKQDDFNIVKPIKCPLCGNRRNWKLDENKSLFQNVQRITIQERPDELPPGEIPEPLTGLLRGSLIRSVTPGDLVRMTVIVKPIQPNSRSVHFENYVEVNYIEVLNKDFINQEFTPEKAEWFHELARREDLDDVLIESFAPSIYGWRHIKEAILLSLFGGVRKEKGGLYRRGDIHILLIGNPGTAKALDIETPILTTNGWKKMRDVVIGDVVFDENGNPCNVIATSPIMYNHDVYDVVFDDRTVITADAGHLWLTSTRASRRSQQVYEKKLRCGRLKNNGRRKYKPIPPSIKTTLEIKNTLKIKEKNGERTNHSIPMAKPVKFPERNLPIPPYTLGIWLGDGNSNDGAITCAEEEILEEIKKDGFKIRKRKSRKYEYGILGLRKLLRENNLLGNKHIPEEYLFSSIEQRLSLLQGLMDSDGTQEPSSSVFITTNKELMQAVRSLLWSLGIKNTVSKATGSYGGKKCKDVFKIYFTTNLPIFRLSRKNKKKRKTQRKTTRQRYIVEVRKRETVPVKCIAVDSPSHLFLCGKELVPTHNTQFLLFASKASVRGVYSSGGGVSGVGLTAALTKDSDGRFVLAAGTMALADMGTACIAEDQFVVTRSGLKRIQEVEVGDWVLGMGGVFEEVVNKFYNGEKDTVVVKLYSGDEVVCTGDHLVLTQRGWVEAGRLTDGDYVKIPTIETGVVDEEDFEVGFIHGFGVSDIYLNEKSIKNGLCFSASKKNSDRTQYVLSLIEKHYGKKPSIYERDNQTTYIKGKQATFSPTISASFSSKKLKRELFNLIHRQRLAKHTYGYKIGFLAGILSTDACVSHKKGSHGVKREITITLGRTKYGDTILNLVKLVNSLFHQLGILSVIRGRTIRITSLRSYNRVVELFKDRVVGKNKAKLYHVEPKTKITSYDSVLDDDYFKWFEDTKFNWSYAVKTGLSSRIYLALKKRRVTVELMETLRPHWVRLAGKPFKPPVKPYLLNPVKSVEKKGKRRVYDLTIKHTHSFVLCGATVHNCLDELDKMNKEDREKIHPAMEQQIIPIDKGGLHATLNSRCGVIAACNPSDGVYNVYKTIPENVKGFPPSLLSRFDLIFIMLDPMDEERDSAMVDRILGLGDTMHPMLSVEDLKQYVAYSKTVTPRVSRDALMRLKTYFISKRRECALDGNGLQITPRQIEALERLTEASARMHLREEASMDDAERAIRLFELYINETWKDPYTGKVDVAPFEGMAPKSLEEQARYLPRIIESMVESGDYHMTVNGNPMIGVRELKEKLLSLGNVDSTRARKIIDYALERDIIWEPKYGYVACPTTLMSWSDGKS